MTQVLDLLQSIRKLSVDFQNFMKVFRSMSGLWKTTQ